MVVSIGRFLLLYFWLAALLLANLLLSIGLVLADGKMRLGSEEGRHIDEVVLLKGKLKSLPGNELKDFN